MTAKWMALKAEAHLLSSAYVTTKIRRGQKGQPSCWKSFVLLFTLVKSPEDILDLEYLLFHQIHP